LPKAPTGSQIWFFAQSPFVTQALQPPHALAGSFCSMHVALPFAKQHSAFDPHWADRRQAPPRATAFGFGAAVAVGVAVAESVAVAAAVDAAPAHEHASHFVPSAAHVCVP
jgi:hypothetical protein